MGFIPIFLQVEGKLCLVVGGGEVALRKVQPLLDAHALVTVISPRVIPAFAKLEKSGRLWIHKRSYRAGDMQEYELVYAATSNRDLQYRLYDEADRLGILINVADAPEFCSFIVPSVVRRGRLQVAISTSGASPATARMLRQRIDEWLGDEFEVLLEVMAGARTWLQRHEANGHTRALKLNTLASRLDDALRRRDAAAVEQIVAQCLGDGVRLADLGVELADFGKGPAHRSSQV